MITPGKILVVDNAPGDVDTLMKEFMNRREHAIYSGIPFTNENCEDSRLLIIDYWLIEQNEKDSLSAICDTIKKLFEKSKFFITVIWSAQLTKANGAEYKKNVIKEYLVRYPGEPIPCFLLDPISKGELNCVQLIEKIEKEIAARPEFNLLLEVEKTIHNAKENVGIQIYNIGGWANLVGALSREYDSESIGRWLLTIYVNMLRRNIKPTDKINECINTIKPKKDAKGKIKLIFNDITDFGKVYSAQYYYEVSKKEQISSGDILYHKKSGKYFVVITPECDIANDKHTATKLVEATKIDNEKLITDSAYARKVAEVFDIKEEADGKIISFKVINAIMQGAGLKNNYGRLLFLRNGDSFYHLVADFNKTRFLKKTKRLSDLRGYSRVCRVDSPMVNSFIQQYASQCSRFGTMTVPKEISLVSKLTTKI